ncbi:MAG: hypothetical protein JW940_22615 [Polyangiaceae bacterium]|nr:hypothetical protein [Polyangiaceae bacterium]
MLAQRRHLPLTAALVAAGLSLVGRTHAQEPGSAGPAGVRLSWVRAEGASSCITAQALEGAVTSRLGHDPFQGESRQWVDGVVFAHEGGFTVQLFERDARGNAVGMRSLREFAGDCRNLDEAVTLAVALIIDPTAKLGPGQASDSALEPPGQATPPRANHEGQRSSPIPRSPPPSTACARCPASVTAPAPACARTSEERLPGLLVSPVLVWDVFPSTAAGVEASTEAFVPLSSVVAWRFGVLFLPELRAHTVGDIGYGLTAVDLGACAISAGDLAWLGCVALQGGAIHTVVHDPTPLKPGDRPWLAGRAHVGARLELPGPFWVESRLFGAVPITRWEFRVRMPGHSPKSAYQQPWFMPGAGIGLGLHFR